MTKSPNPNLSALASNPRASLVSWLRFEPIVIDAHRRYPSPFVYTPTSLSPASVASKIRDAIRGKIAFNYESSIATAAVSTWWSNVVVTHDHEKVYIGPKVKKLESVEGTVHGDWAFAFDTLTFPEIYAFELLIANGRIKGPVLINNPPPLEVPTAQTTNVERIYKPDGKLILL